MEERTNNFWMKNQGNINFWGTKVMLKTCYEYFNGVAVNEEPYEYFQDFLLNFECPNNSNT
jgi:hypothetical protein